MRNFPLNILSSTQTVIGTQDYQVKKSLGRTRNDAGFFATEFARPLEMKGSVQPVNSKQYKDMGLDFKKAYIKIYDTELIKTLNRNKNADQIIYDGFLWHVAEDTNWFLSGGWNYVLCVRLESVKI